MPKTTPGWLILAATYTAAREAAAARKLSGWRMLAARSGLDVGGRWRGNILIVPGWSNGLSPLELDKMNTTLATAEALGCVLHRPNQGGKDE